MIGFFVFVGVLVENIVFCIWIVDIVEKVGEVKVKKVLKEIGLFED